MQQGNPFYVSPLGGLDLAQSARNAYGLYQDRKATEMQQQQVAQQQAQQKEIQQLATAMQNGDMQAGQTLYAKYPELAAKVDAGMKIQDERQAKQVGGFFEKLVAIPTLQGKRDFLQQTAGKTPFTIDDDLSAMDDETLERSINVTAPRYLSKEQLAAIGGGDATKGPSAVEETKWFMKQPENVQQAHLKLKRGEQLSAEEKLALEGAKSDIKVEEAGRKKTAEGIAGRQQGFIDSGIEAADSLANVRRARKLLDGIETGGFDRVQLAAKRMFGVESADEAELSANLGKAILAQLKPIFGAAFTAAEGERLEKIEANFGKSTEGNKRLLEQVMKITDRAARRGLKAAESAGDEFTADEIRASMEMDLEDDLFLMDNDDEAQPMPGDIQEGQIIENPQTGQRLILRGGQWVEVQ